MSTLRTVLGPAVPFLLAAAPAFAQVSDAEAKAEIEFARGLAADWAFVDLAEQVIRELEREGVTKRIGEELGIVKCEVYTIGAKGERDPVRRNELFEEALTAYADFIENNRSSSQLAKAEAAFVNTSALYAQALALALEEAVGEEAERMRARQTDILSEASKLTQHLIDGLRSIPSEDRTEEETRELYELMLNRGKMLAEIGKTHTTPATPEGGIFFFNQAIQTLEDLVFLAVEGTPPALRAYVAMGDVFAYQQDWDNAATFYQAVIEQTIPTDRDVWLDASKDLTEAQKGLRFLFLEIATKGLMEALVNSGRIAEACRYGLHYYNTQRREGFQFTPYGYLSLLAVARALLDSGGFVGGDLVTGDAVWYETEEEMDANHPERQQRSSVDLALRLAQGINEANRGNILQVRAQKLISDITSRAGVAVAPDVLIEAAEGEYFEKNYSIALESYRRVMRSIEGADTATRSQYGSQVLNKVGRCFRALDRPLEAAMAFREGCTIWQDPLIAGTNAQSYYSMMTTIQRAAVLDKDALAAMVREAEQLVQKWETDAQDQVQWTIGERERNNKDYPKAIEAYKAVEKSSTYYEKAKVQIGNCHFRMGEVDEALKIFDDYVENYVRAPENAINGAAAETRRKEALAVAEFYRGLIVYTRGEHEKVVEYLADYFAKYPDQTGFTPFSMANLMRSYLALGKRAEARQVLAQMVESYPEETKTGEASAAFYTALGEMREASQDPEERTGILREMAEYLEISNGLGSPKYQNLRNESQHWMELGEWARAEPVLVRIQNVFADDPEAGEAVAKYVLPDLGQTFLMQRKTAEARAVLEPIALEGASKETTRAWCLSVIGWPQEDGSGGYEVVPGAGETAEDYSAVIDKLAALRGVEDRWGCRFYGDKFMIAWGYYVWGELDSRKRESAKEQIQNMANLLGEPDLASIDAACDSEETPKDVRAAFGNGVLRARFLWLRSMLNR